MWPPFGKELLIRLTVCSLCIMSICKFGCSHFGIADGTVILIVPVPVQCLHLLLTSLTYWQARQTADELEKIYRIVHAPLNSHVASRHA